LLRRAYGLDGVEQLLPDTGILPGKIKHLNGLRVAYRHVCHGTSLVAEC
jgi:hypothetical protein